MNAKRWLKTFIHDLSERDYIDLGGNGTYTCIVTTTNPTSVTIAGSLKMNLVAQAIGNLSVPPRI
jgi:hypothetical protein